MLMLPETFSHVSASSAIKSSKAHSKADKKKRRRQRFLNKRNCLTMVGLYYFSLSYSNALDQKKVHAC